MIFNLKTEQYVDCYYREVGIEEVGEYVPPQWVFDFKKEYAAQCDVFTMETKEYPGIAQGVIALQVQNEEETIFLKSAEAAHSNKTFFQGLEREGYNEDRIYTGVGANLVAFACQYSLEKGCHGHIHLVSKTQTVPFYQKLGGRLFSAQNILFDESAGVQLAKKFFPGGAIKWL